MFFLGLNIFLEKGYGDSLGYTDKDYKENVSQWEYFIRSYNGGFDYMVGQYLNRYNLEQDFEFNQRN